MSQPVFVSLKPNSTMALFLANDQKYPQESQVASSIIESFSIGSFSGFSGNFSETMLERLKRCPYVSQVAPDIVMHSFEVVVQRNAPGHLARLSQRASLESKPFEYFFDAESTGKGVNAYIIDSGINLDHPEFEGRAKFGIDFTGEGTGDSHGHGSHVAGLVGSRTFGASKQVELYDVKALDRDGLTSLSVVVAALEFSLKHMQRSGRRGVVNMSLGSERNEIINEAITAAISLGLVVVAAAGNTNINACLTSPASTQNVITVGAIDDTTDELAWFSNWGNCVDVFASGNAVYSVNAFNPKHPLLLSGTSMAAPIVTGLVANLLSGGIHPSDIRDVVIAISSKNRIDPGSLRLRGTPNRIAFNGVLESEDFDPDEAYQLEGYEPREDSESDD